MSKNPFHAMILLLAGMMLMASVATANTFDVSAIVGNNQTTNNPGTPTGKTLTGTLDINTTTGVVTAISLTLQGDANIFNNILNCTPSGTCYFNAGFAEFGELVLTLSPNLIGYGGGSLLSGSYLDTGSVAYNLSGTVTPESAVPEPSSLFLFGGGLAGLAGIIRRKLNR